MLTDDDLTRDLRAAFRDTTEDLSYDGAVPAGPHTPVWARAGWVALPAAAAVAASVVVVGHQPADVTAPPSAAPSMPTAPTAPTAPGTSATPAPELVTDTIEVAGFTMSYRRPAGAAPAEEHLFTPDDLPDDAREVTFPEMSPGRAWVGTDPATGDPAVYLEAPTRNNGVLFGLSVPGFDEAALIDLLKNGSRD